MSPARRILALALTALLGGGLYAGWAGFAFGPVAWPGAEALLGGTWLWDLRWPLLPAYAVALLWAAETAAGWLAARTANR